MSCCIVQGFDTLTQARQHAENILLKKGGRSFDPSKLKALLSSLVTTRENSGYSGSYIIKLTPYPGTQFVIWGPLKGAFKSLVRDLTYLEKIGILGNDFKIRDPHVYFVFNGDVIDGSSDVLEVFMLVLSLMKANPHRVLYMRGSNEDHWQDGGLKDALQARAKGFTRETIPLGGLVARFLDTLSLGLFIGDSAQGLIRISSYPGDHKELDERSCSSILQSRLMNVAEICSLGKPQKGQPNVKVIIKSENRLMSYKQHEGLMLVEPDRGAIAWSVFSGPTRYYQDNYEFFSDAFVILTTDKDSSDASLTLYNRDVRDFQDFKSVGSYLLTTGQIIPQRKKVVRKQPELSHIQKRLKKLYNDIDDLMLHVAEDTAALSKKESR